MLDSISLLRVIKAGLVNFTRNLWLSTAATMVMTITLVIFSILFLLFAITSYSLTSVKDRVDISVYFKNGLVEDKILTIKDSIIKDPKVREVRYTSAVQALQEFKERHQNDPLIQQSLNELSENPLPAALNIKANTLEDYPAVAEALKNPDYAEFIDRVNYEDNQSIIERLSKILNFIITIGIALVLVFSVIAVLVIFNTITLTIYNRKEEIEIMRLVGATNWYIRGPFLTEAFLYAFLATVISSALFLPVFTSVLPKIALFVNPEITFFNQNILNFWYLSIIMLVIALLLASASTFFAVRKYLKV
jgi:cell division transport system permease protein